MPDSIIMNIICRSLVPPLCVQISLERSKLANFREHPQDLEHDQGRHQGIHGHRQGEARYNQRIQRWPVNGGSRL